MNSAFLSLMSGPLMALARYAVTAGATYVAAAHVIPDTALAQISAGLVAAIPALVGAATSTAQAALAKAASQPGVKVQLPNGKVAESAKDVLGK